MVCGKCRIEWSVSSKLSAMFNPDRWLHLFITEEQFRKGPMLRKITSPLESDSMYLKDNKLYLIIMVLLKLRPIVLFRLVVRARSKTLVNGNN